MKKYNIFFLCGIIGLLSSCINDIEDCDSVFIPSDEEETMYLQFRITPELNTGESGTRAVDDDAFDKEDHPQEGGIAAENHISFDDMKLYVCNSQTGIIIQELTPENGLENNNVLTFTAKVTASPASLSTSGNSFGFTIVALANWNSIGGNYPQVTEGLTTLGYLEQVAGFTFIQNSNWTPAIGNGAGKYGIPMYGKQSYTGISYDDLKGTTMASPLLLYTAGTPSKPYHKDINLLRSMAKLEVADRIEKNNTGFPKVLNVSVKNYTTSGLYIPTPTAFHNSNGTEVGYNQVFKTSLPENLTMATAAKPFGWVNKYATTPDSNGNDWDQYTDITGWWTTYMPEMNYTTSEAATSPQLEITIQRAAGGESEVKTVPLPQFPTSLGMIMRNHIYRIEVTMASQETNLTLRYGICPWVTETINIPTFD